MTQYDPGNVELPSGIPSYVASLIRFVLTFGGGWLLAKGYFTAEQMPQLIAGVAGAIALVWSFIQKRNANKDLKAAILAPVGSDGK